MLGAAFDDLAISVKQRCAAGRARPSTPEWA